MHRGIEGRLIEGELNEGWPDKHIAPAIDQHSLPRPLVQEAQLEPSELPHPAPQGPPFQLPQTAILSDAIMCCVRPIP